MANPIVRNIVGQQKSAFNIRKIMDEGKILIVNLSRGQVGEDNAAILGALMVTKIQLAAMSRADMNLAERRPFYLYVDEFQNFATDSFAVILSEARKYGLNLTVANQYVSQMPEVVRDAVFGNVGTMISFRIGPGDAVALGKYFEPTFEAADLTRLHNQNIFTSMIVDGEKALPFSAKTLRMPDPEQNLSDRIISISRERYASGREEVEAAIRSRTDESTDQGARTVGVAVGEGSPGQPTSAPGFDQKPNKPKSEFLAALQNPNLPPTQAQPRPERKRGEGDGTFSNAQRDANNRRDNSQRPAPQHPPRQREQRGKDGRNEAVRQAIQAVQADLAQQQGSEPAQHHTAPTVTQPAPTQPTNPQLQPGDSVNLR